MKSTDDLLSEEDAKNAPREVMRLVNHMMSGDGDVVSGHTSLFETWLAGSDLFADSPTFSPRAEIQRWWKSSERFDKISACHPTPGVCTEAAERCTDGANLI